MRWTVIRASSLQSVPWRNGRGTSRNIVTELARNGGLAWQVGIAELVQDAPFSRYEHCDRIFTPVAGTPPVELAFNDGSFEPCPLLMPRAFPGECPTLCRVPAPGRAFNLIADRRRHRIAVEVLHLEAADGIEIPDAPHVVLHCLSGALAVAGELLSPGDSLLGAGPATPGAAAEDSIALLALIHPA